MSSSLARLGLAGVAVAVAAVATAGPCVECSPTPGNRTGWWNDRPISDPAAAPASVRIDADEISGDAVLAVVWEDRAGGDGDLALATSRYGCAWSVRAITSGADDDRAPDITQAAALGRITIAFARAGRPFAIASSDGGASFSAPLAIHPTATVDPTSPLRVAGVPVGLDFQVHAVWGEGTRIYHALSRSGGEPGTWIVTTLSDRFSGFDGWARPEVAVDTRSIDPAATSAVTVVAVGRGPGRSVDEAFGVRSNDGGGSFLGDPADVLSVDTPRLLSDPRADDPSLAVTGPILDGNDDGSGIFFVWNVTAWAAPAGASVDARAEDGAAPTVVADWNDPDVLAGGGAPVAIAVVPNPIGRPPTPDLHVFFDDTPGGVREVTAVRGLLDQNALPTVVLGCAPYQLTGVTPTRSGGQAAAGTLSADEDLNHVYAVWIDDRDGAARVWFKRTDTFTLPPTMLGVSPVACPTGGLEVAWTAPSLPPHCDIERFRVEWGLAPGVYDDQAEVAGSPLAVGGLFDAATYFVRVTSVDEACNEWSSFEASATTLDCGGPTACPNPVGNSLLQVRSGVDVALSWQAPAADPSHGPATSYDVYRSTATAASGYGLLANSLTTAEADPGAVPPSPSATHYYRIVARNACGTSGDEPPP